MTEHTNQVFLSDVEQSRLWEQCRLLRPLEEPLWDELMATHRGSFLLDIGCNDGTRTMDRFGKRSLRKLIGIEYLEEAVHRARERHGGEAASFYCLDAEAEDFDKRLHAIMRAEGIDRFDFVSCSVVMSHLKNPRRALEAILSVLRPGGTLVMLESDDSAARLLPDPEGLMAMFADACRIDPYSGDRSLGEKAESMLAQAGFVGIRRLRPQLRAEAEEAEKKGLLYDCFFPLFPRTFASLRRNIRRIRHTRLGPAACPTERRSFAGHFCRRIRWPFAASI